MSRARLLLLIPALLIGGVVAITVARLMRVPEVATTGPRVEVESVAADGLTLQVEHRPGSETFAVGSANGNRFFIRGEDRFEYRLGIPLVNGTAFPSPSPGDTVRWNLDGPLLINGQPVAPHRFQPRPLDAPPTELKWDIRNPSDAPRDSLSADWSKVGRVLVTAHGDGVARVWDVEKGAVRTFITPDAPTDGRKRWGLRAAVSPDGKTVAAANVQAAAVTLWEADTGKLIATLAEPAGKVTDLRFGSDRVLFEARGGTLYSRDLTGDRSKVTKIGPVRSDVSAPFAYVPEVLAVSDERRVYLPLRDDTGAKLTPTAIHDIAAAADALALGPDGRLLAVADDTGALSLRETASGTLRMQLWWRKRSDGSIPAVGAMVLFADGKTLAVGAADGLRLYDVETGRERGWVQTLGIRSLAVSGDGAFLAATAEHGPAVYLWRTAGLLPK